MKIRNKRVIFISARLAQVALIGGLSVFSIVSAYAAVPAVNPQSGSVGLSGSVPGPPPSTSATIVLPPSGNVTDSVPDTITGTCTPGDFVSITDNGSFAGATTCSAHGTYSIPVDLFDGNNAVVAQISDALGQYGPNSVTINIRYNAPEVTLPGGVAAKQLFLEADTAVVAGDPNTVIARAVTIVGGVAPYAVSWDWGDGTSSLDSEANGGPVSDSHTYTRPGTYTVIVKVTDSAGNSAYMQLVTVVNGKTEAIGSSNGQGLGAVPGTLVSSWPLFGLGAIVVVTFWFGEMWQMRKLRRMQSG